MRVGDDYLRRFKSNRQEEMGKLDVLEVVPGGIYKRGG
jgi:hypothetical protein